MKDDDLKTIEEMKIHEKEHCEFFENEIKKETLSQQNFYQYGIYLSGLGLVPIFSVKAMLCTASVEEVIDKHYQSQITQLGPEEKDLKKKL